MKLDICWRAHEGDRSFDYHFTVPNWVLVTSAALLSATWLTHRALTGWKA